VERGCLLGQIQGQALGASPRTVNRVIRCCDDCQAFVYYWSLSLGLPGRSPTFRARRHSTAGLAKPSRSNALDL
jgi:hypothetical protein